MVKLALQFKASLEGITQLQPGEEDFRWYFKIRCNNCGDINENWVYVSLLETHPLKGGRGNAHLVMKCKLCSRENSLSILEESLNSYNIEDNCQFKTIAAFDCRGLELTDFDPRGGFTAKSTESDTIFEEIDLSTKEWADYDEKSGTSVSIFEIEHQFKKL